MGRMKLEIRKLEQNNSRQITYSKRRNGIMKKAKELAVLCDIDIVLLMFSPSGKPALFIGQKSTMEEVMEKFCKLTPQERRKRKLESLEALKKTFKKTNHDVDFEEFLDASPQKLEELKAELAKIQTQVLSLQEKTRHFWDERHQVNNLTLEQTRDAEERIMEALTQVRMRKEVLKHSETLVPVEATGKYYHDNLPMPSIECFKQLASVPSMPSSGEFMMPHDDGSMRLSQREMEYFGTATLPAPKFMYNCREAPIDDTSNLSFLNCNNSYTELHSIANQPHFPLNKSFLHQENDNGTPFVAIAMDGLPQHWSTSGYAIEPGYDNLLDSWQQSVSTSESSSSSTCQQIETLGQEEPHPNMRSQITYSTQMLIQGMTSLL